MFHSVTIKLYVHLPPKFVSTPLLGIHDHLNRYLLKYNQQLNGVVMSYSDINVQSNLARIINESPFIHFYITCTFLLFKPFVGMLLKGVVNLQSPGHIGLVIFNLFNVSIPRTEILQYGFQFVPSISTDQVEVQQNSSIVNGNWVHVASNTPLSTGSDLEFVVLEITPSRHLIEMKGSLKDVTFPDAIAAPACNSDMNCNTKPEQKQNQGFQSLTTFSDNDDSMEQQAATISSEPKIKAKKSRKLKNQDTITIPNSDPVFPPTMLTTATTIQPESKPRNKNQMSKRSKDASNSSNPNPDHVVHLPNTAQVTTKIKPEPVDNLVKLEATESKKGRKRSRPSIEQNSIHGTDPSQSLAPLGENVPGPDVVLKKPKLEFVKQSKKQSRSS